MILRLARLLATSWRPEHRWRRAAVPLAAGMTMVLVLVAMSIWAMFQRQADRAAGRAVVEAEEARPTDLSFLPRSDDWNNLQYVVNWIEPAGEGAPILPPGLDVLPPPGVAAVSPALARLIDQEPALAARYPRYETLDSMAGLVDEGELIAWVRAEKGKEITGASGALRIQRFGPAGWDYSIVANPDAFSLRVVLVLFLLLPAALLLFLGLATASRLRAERLAMLTALGAGWGWLIRFVLAEALFLVLPSIALATVVWGPVAARIDRLPFVGKDVVRGDLALRPGERLLAMLMVTALAGVLVLLMTVVPAWFGRARQHARPTAGGRSVLVLRAVPVVAALGAVTTGGLLALLGESQRGATVLIYGFAALVGTVPLAVPTLIAPVGRWLAGRGSVPALLAGRRIQWDPIRTGRPFTMLAALVVIASMIMSFLTNLTDREPPPPRSDRTPSVVFIGWFARDERALEEAGARLRPAIVAPLTEEGRELRLGVTCAQLAGALGWSPMACSAEAPYRLDQDGARELSELFWGRDAQLDPTVDGVDDGRVAAAVLSIETGDAATAAVRRGLPFAAYPGLSITSDESFELRTPPLAKWLNYGVLAAVFVTGLACFVAVVDRVIATQYERRYLTRVGLTPTQLRRVELWAFLIPYAVIVSGAGLLGVVSTQASLLIQGDRMPIGGFMVMGALLAVLGIVAAVAVAFLGSVGEDGARVRDAR